MIPHGARPWIPVCLPPNTVAKCKILAAVTKHKRGAPNKSVRWGRQRRTRKGRGRRKGVRRRQRASLGKWTHYSVLVENCGQFQRTTGDTQGVTVYPWTQLTSLVLWLYSRTIYPSPFSQPFKSPLNTKYKHGLNPLHLSLQTNKRKHFLERGTQIWNHLCLTTELRHPHRYMLLGWQSSPISTH